jgi:hypothetical protein
MAAWRGCSMGCGRHRRWDDFSPFTFGHVRQLDASPGCWPSFCIVANAHAGVENSDPETHLVLDRHHQHVREAICAALTTRRSGAGRTQPSSLTTRPKCCPCWRSA